MTLEEIFKDKPELLNEPEVQKLIEFAQKSHKRNYGIYLSYKKFFDDVLDVVVYSDQMLIKGTPSEETVQKILQLTNDF